MLPFRLVRLHLLHACTTQFHQWGTHPITLCLPQKSHSVSTTIVLRTVMVLQITLAVYAAHFQSTYQEPKRLQVNVVDLYVTPCRSPY